MRLITCHIGCISPRRQARKRLTLQTSKTHFVMHIGLKTIGQQNRDLTWWRFGFRVRERKRCETMYGKAIFHNVFPKCVAQCSVGADPPPRPEEKMKNCPRV